MLIFIFCHNYVKKYYMLKEEISSHKNNTMGRTAVIIYTQSKDSHRVSFSFSSTITPPLGAEDGLQKIIFVFISGKFMAWDMIMERVGQIKILWVDSSFKHFQIVKRYLSQRLNSARLPLHALIFPQNSSISAKGCSLPSSNEFVFGKSLSSMQAPATPLCSSFVTKRRALLKFP